MATKLSKGRSYAMARRLKVYETSLGFYDLTIAAPSMKSALEAWGAESNLFHQGVAKESDDPEVIAAAMSKPGIVLRRPVGSNEPFQEHAAHAPIRQQDRAKTEEASREAKKTTGPRDRPQGSPQGHAGVREGAEAACVQGPEGRGREAEAARAARAGNAKAQREMEKAKRQHDRRAASIEAKRALWEKQREKLEAKRAAFERRSQAEEARWEKQKEELEIRLRRAQDQVGS
jgi:colicin import membrane protein